MRFLTVGFLILGAAACAQDTSAPKQNLVSQPGALKITAIEGEGAINNIRTKSATQLVVEVHDEAGKPVAGAEVVFQLPAAGPGGVFNGWMRTQTARTNPEGRAGSNGLTPNNEEGRFNIKVTASMGSKSGSLVIGQSNAQGGGAGGAKAKSGSGTWWKVLIVAGAAGLAGGIIYGVTRETTPAAAATATTPITITPGSITVGGPR